MMKPSISSQLFLKKPINENMFELIRSYGFSRCELWAMGDHIDYKNQDLKKKIKTWIEKYNISPDTAHLPLYTKEFPISLGNKEYSQKSLDELLYATDFLHNIDVKTFIIHMDGDLDLFFENLSKLYKNSDGIFAFENTPNGSNLVKDVIDAIIKIRRALKNGESRIGACLDIGHANIWEKPPEESIKKLKKIVLATHISDNDGKSDLHLPPGDGTIDWTKIIENFREIDYSQNFTFEIAPLFGFEEIPKVLERLKKFCEQNNIQLE